MYYVMRASVPSLHRESTDSLIIIVVLLSPSDGHWIHSEKTDCIRE